jgi:hypothetical protein
LATITLYQRPDGPNRSAEFIEEAGRGAGVLVTARRTFDIAHAWGGKHPMDVPMVVVTHRMLDAIHIDLTPVVLVL